MDTHLCHQQGEEEDLVFWDIMILQEWQSVGQAVLWSIVWHSGHLRTFLEPLFVPGCRVWWA